MNTYPLVSDEHYGWFTGIAKDGRLVIVSNDSVTPTLCFKTSNKQNQSPEPTARQRHAKLVAQARAMTQLGRSAKKRCD
jgi:hypothetical protein